MNSEGFFQRLKWELNTYKNCMVLCFLIISCYEEFDSLSHSLRTGLCSGYVPVMRYVFSGVRAGHVAGIDRQEIWGAESMYSLKSGSVTGIKRHSKQKRINDAIQNGERKE